MKIPHRLRRHWFPLAIAAGFPVYALVHSGPGNSCSPLLPNLIPTAYGAGLPATISQAPAWELKTVDGATLSSADFAGQPVVLNFWGTWCPPCREEIPALIKLQSEFEDRGLAVIGIAAEQNPAGLGKFVDQNEINYPVVLADAEVLAAYGGVKVFPTTFFINAEGKVVSYVEGALPYETFEKAAKSLFK